MTIILAVWGAALSTILACLALYDRHVKNTGRVRVTIERATGYGKLDFSRRVRRLDEGHIPVDDKGQPDVSPFDEVFCFQVINASESPVEIRFAEIFVKMGFCRQVPLVLGNGPLGDKLPGRNDYCVYAICASNIFNGFFGGLTPTFPAKCCLEVRTSTGRRFRSQSFVVGEIFEESVNGEIYSRWPLNYSKR